MKTLIETFKLGQRVLTQGISNSRKCSTAAATSFTKSEYISLSL